MRVCLFFVLAAAALAQPAPVMVISVDTLRADRLSAYGYRKQRTPNLDSFADHATLYENAACATPLTLPSIQPSLYGHGEPTGRPAHGDDEG